MIELNILTYLLTFSDALSNLNMFDGSNSFFSSSPAFQQSLLLKNKVEGDMRQPQVTSSHLPDLLNGNFFTIFVDFVI